MKTFTNKNVQKEKKKKWIGLVFSFVVIVLSFGFYFWADQTEKQINKETVDLNSIITNAKEKEQRKSYLDVKSVPYQFAVQEGNENSYYIVSDGTYLYVLYMGPSDYQKLNNEKIYDKAIRVEGITDTPIEDIQKLAVDAYNKSLKDASKKITLNDYNNYFGAVYLDLTKDASSVAGFQYFLFFLCFIIGIVSLFIVLIRMAQFNRSIKKLDGTQIDELDHEMNDKDAFYYEKAHLYLTEHYIINLLGIVRIIKYEDILWMYSVEQRVNGVRTAQHIKLFTNEGKTYTIASIDMVTKKKKEIFDEIWDTIASKNDKMRLGYNDENRKEMNQKAKEIKKERKMKK